MYLLGLFWVCGFGTCYELLVVVSCALRLFVLFIVVGCFVLVLFVFYVSYGCLFNGVDLLAV